LTAAVMPSGKRWVADVGGLQERRQFPVRFLNHALDLLQGVCAGARFVSVVERLQEGKVLARFSRNVLDCQGFGRTQLFSRLQRSHQRRKVQRHLRKYRQVRQRDADPLGAASGCDQRNAQGTAAPGCPAERSSAEQNKIATGRSRWRFFLEAFEVISKCRQALARPRTYAAFSLACATRKIVLSSKCRPRICNPMGSFSLVSPQGTEIPGIPARSAVTV